jgi:hypothetical protein
MERCIHAVMLRLKHFPLLLIMGGTWLLAGAWLLPLGLNFILTWVENNRFLMDPESGLILPYLSNLLGGVDAAAIILIVLGLALGNIKGRLVMQRAAIKKVKEVSALPNPAPILQAIGLKYILIIVLMVGIGMGIKFLDLSKDFRGFIDVAIGAALIQGGVTYFRYAFQARKLAAK